MNSSPPWQARADADGDGYVTGAELGQFLETKVTNYSRGAQTPQYGKLRDPLLDKGDFVFVLPKTAPRAQAPTGGNGTDREAQFWDSIHASTSGGDYCAYLETFPRGTFVALAIARAKQYGGACARTASAVRFDYDFKGGPYVRRGARARSMIRAACGTHSPRYRPPKGAHGGYGLIGDDRLLGKESGYGLRQLGAVARRYVRFEKMHIEQPEGFLVHRRAVGHVCARGPDERHDARLGAVRSARQIRGRSEKVL